MDGGVKGWGWLCQKEGGYWVFTWAAPTLPGLLGQSALARRRQARAQQGQWGYSGTGDEGEGDTSSAQGTSYAYEFLAGNFSAVSDPMTPLRNKTKKQLCWPSPSLSLGHF